MEHPFTRYHRSGEVHKSATATLQNQSHRGAELSAVRLSDTSLSWPDRTNCGASCLLLLLFTRYDDNDWHRRAAHEATLFSLLLHLFGVKTRGVCLPVALTTRTTSCMCAFSTVALNHHTMRWVRASGSGHAGRATSPCPSRTLAHSALRASFAELAPLGQPGRARLILLHLRIRS